MFKALIVCIVLGLGAIVFYCGYQVYTILTDKPAQPSEEAVDELIDKLKTQIASLQTKADAGIIDAKLKLETAQSELLKAETLKEKTKNL